MVLSRLYDVSDLQREWTLPIVSINNTTSSPQCSTQTIVSGISQRLTILEAIWLDQHSVIGDPSSLPIKKVDVWEKCKPVCYNNCPCSLCGLIKLKRLVCKYGTDWACGRLYIYVCATSCVCRIAVSGEAVVCGRIAGNILLGWWLGVSGMSLYVESMVCSVWCLASWYCYEI